MELILLPIIIGSIAFIGGLAGGYWLRKSWAKKRKDSVEAKIEKSLIEAKGKQKELLLEAQEKSLKLIDEAKGEAKQIKQEADNLRLRLEKRESLFDQKLLELENQKTDLSDRNEKLIKAKEEIQKIKEDQLAKLEKIAGFNKEEAQKVLLDNAEKMIADNLVQRIKKLENEASDELEKKAKEVLSAVIERCASSHASETTSSTVDLPSDDLKGRIIGREGRNIKTIEQLTGVEIIIDDTPQAITLSSFSPIRRQVAKRENEDRVIA